MTVDHIMKSRGEFHPYLYRFDPDYYLKSVDAVFWVLAMFLITFLVYISCRVQSLFIFLEGYDIHICVKFIYVHRHWAMFLKLLFKIFSNVNAYCISFCSRVVLIDHNSRNYYDLTCILVVLILDSMHMKFYSIILLTFANSIMRLFWT